MNTGGKSFLSIHLRNYWTGCGQNFMLTLKSSVNSTFAHNSAVWLLLYIWTSNLALRRKKQVGLSYVKNANYINVYNLYFEHFSIKIMSCIQCNVCSAINIAQWYLYLFVFHPVIFSFLFAYWLFCSIMKNRSCVAQSLQCLSTDWTTGVRSPARTKHFSSSFCVQTSSEGHPASCPMGAGGLFPGGKARLERKGDHSPSSSAEV
jgi:ferredoxin